MYSDLDQDKQIKWAFLIAAGLSLAFFLFLQILLPCGMLQVLIPDIPIISNLAAYVLTLVLFVLTFCMFFFCFRRTRVDTLERLLERPVSPKEYTTTFVIGSAALLILLATRRMITEKTEFGMSSRLSFHQFPEWMGVSLFLVLVILAIIFSQKINTNRSIFRKIPYIYIYICGIGIVFLNFICTLVMNIFYADIHHGVAYIESIYNVYYGVPYTHITSGVYGYHGLFLAPVLHLFGGKSFALMITLSLLQCLITVLCFYCVSTLTKNNWVRIFAVLMCSLSTMSMRVSNYWQVQPHRVLWPLILISFVLHLVKTNRWCSIDKIIGYSLCAAAVLWNVESGLFCGIAFAAACIIHDWQQHTWYSIRSLLNALLHIGAVLVTVVIAILIVNGYNYLCGWREWFLVDFFFPVLETDYMSGFLEVDMPIGNHAWVYVITLFGGLFLWALYMTSFIHGKATSRNTISAKSAPAMMTVAMLGLCNFSYYANRAAYANLDIILQLAGIAVCMLWCNIQENAPQRRNTRIDCGKAIISYVSLLLMITLSLEAVLFSVPQLYRKIKNNHYDTHAYKQACMMLEETVPKDTFAFGGGISMLYADLGWDPIGHYRDMSDLTVGGSDVKNTIVKDVLSQDSFAAYLSTERESEIVEQILQAAPGFSLTEEIMLNGIPLQYYVRSE